MRGFCAKNLFAGFQQLEFFERNFSAKQFAEESHVLQAKTKNLTKNYPNQRLLGQAAFVMFCLVCYSPLRNRLARALDTLVACWNSDSNVRNLIQIS